MLRTLISFQLLLLAWVPTMASESMAFRQEWKFCRKANECIVFKGCCDWVVTNQRYFKQMKAHDASLCPVVECIAPPRFGTEPQVQCIRDRCELSNPKK